MLLVRASVGPSEIHGIGLFAAERIAAGTITWRYDPRYDTIHSPKSIDALTPWARRRFLEHAYWDHERRLWVLCFDDQRFINHSDTVSNIRSELHQDVALRDIAVGEELLCDYRGYESDWFERRGLKPDFSFLEEAKRHANPDHSGA